MTVLLVAAVIILTLVAAVALVFGPLPAKRVPPARPRRDTIHALNELGKDADRIYR